MIPIFEFIIDPEDNETGMRAISLVDRPAIESEYIAFNKEEKRVVFKFKDDKKFIISGLALIPNKLIYREDEENFGYFGFFSEDTIEQIMNKFMLESTDGTTKNVNFQHNPDNQVQAHLIESFILRTPEMVEAVKDARKLGADSIGVNAEDASRTRVEYLIEFARAAREAGVDRIRYCDTLGCDTPFTIYERIKLLAEEVKIPIEIHCHNDLGLVVANSIAGARAACDSGVDAYINTCVNGMGERAGNADLVSVILAIKYGSGMQAYSLDEKIDLKMAWKISKYASYAFSVPIPINQPGVGSNAFAHESGIHADGALKDRRNYELYDYEELGRGEPEIIETGRKITAGEYSGIKGFRNVYEKLEVVFRDDQEATQILELVRYANVHNQKPLVDDELSFIAKYPDIARKIFTMTP